MTNVSLGQAAYKAYGDQVGWKNFRGDPMPSWDDLTYEIQDGWISAALAVARLANPAWYGQAE